MPDATDPSKSLRSSRRITAADVARRAGVSAVTVSITFSGRRSRHVSDETRERIRKIAHEMGYVPSRLGKGFLRGRSRIVGLVVHHTPVESWLDGVLAIHEGLSKAGYIPITLTPASLRNAPESADAGLPTPLVEVGYLRRLLEYQIDGLIYVAVNPEQAAEIMPDVKRYRIPLVLLGNSPDPPEADMATVDEQMLGRMVAKHLLSLGMRSFLLVENESIFLGPIIRREAFIAELAKAGNSCQRIILASDSNESLERQWPGDIPLPVGIFTSNDLDAGTAANAALARGLRVPEDVAVVGLGDSEMARRNWLPLASVRRHTDQVGREAVKMLLERLNGFDGPPRRVLISPTLELRKSALSKPGPEKREK